MTKLPPIKKCSFVEGEPKLFQSMVEGYYVQQGAHLDDFQLQGALEPTQRKAIELWNRKVK